MELTDEKLAELEECARAWEPDVRLLGNVTARDLVDFVAEVRRLRKDVQIVKDRDRWWNVVRMAEHGGNCQKIFDGSSAARWPPWSCSATAPRPGPMRSWSTSAGWSGRCWARSIGGGEEERTKGV